VILLVEEELYQRVAKLETKVEDHDKKLQIQVEKNESLTRLATLVELQMQESKERERRQEIRDEKQNKQMEKFSATLDKVNDNLTDLNISQQQMKQDMNAIGNRVADIEQYQEDAKIDPLKLFKGILSYVVTGIGSIAIAVLIWLLTEGNK
jgi:hypothetical protein